MVGVESMCIGNIDVHVPAALRFQVGASHLKIPVPEQFPVGRQAVGLLEGCFCLQIPIQVVCGGQPVSQGVVCLGLQLVSGGSVPAFVHRPFHIRMVILAESHYVPDLAGEEFI